MATQTVRLQRSGQPVLVFKMVLFFGAVFLVALVALVVAIRFQDGYNYDTPSPLTVLTIGMTNTPVGSTASVIFVENTDLMYISDGQVSGWRLSAAHQNYENSVSSVSRSRTADYTQCAAQERYITVFSAEEVLCYQDISLPPIQVLANLEFEFSDQESVVRDILMRPTNIAFLPSDANRAPGAGVYFHDHDSIYYLFWLAGDCTPRIVDGQGGYWQMPVSPTFGSYIPWGIGYLIEFPSGWQESWRRDLSESAPWRLCAPSTFSWGSLD